MGAWITEYPSSCSEPPQSGIPNIVVLLLNGTLVFRSSTSFVNHLLLGMVRRFAFLEASLSKNSASASPPNFYGHLSRLRLMEEP